MIERLYYCYLDYQKDQNKIIWKNITKLPRYILIYTIVFLAIIITDCVLIFLPSLRILLYIFSLVIIIAIVIMYFITEHFHIANGNSGMDKYREYCEKLNNWLQQKNITTDEKIHLVHTRLIEYITEKKSERIEQNNRVDKWTQALAIPVVITIIAAVMNKFDDFGVIMTYIFTLLSMFIVINGFICLMRTITWLPDKRKIEQMKYFAEDLQGILDLHSIEKMP